MTEARMRPHIRYTGVAMALHWLIALAILAMVVLGIAMTKAHLPVPTMFKLYQLHKSIGITVLGLVVLRVLWRLTHRPPPLPAGMSRPEVLAASGTHVVLYALMIGMPITGWMLVSVSPFNIPTVLYGIVPWPHLPILSTLHDKAPVEAVMKAIHGYGAFLVIGFVGLHAAAALRHHFLLRDDVLRRMLPGRRAAFADPAFIEKTQP